MAGLNMVMNDEAFKLVEAELQKLIEQVNGKVIFLVDKNGQMIASAGQTKGIDTTALASLTAGNIAATAGMAQLLGEKEFSILFHEGEKDNIHIALVGTRIILVTIFDSRSALGIVRLRVKKAVDSLGPIFEDIFKKSEKDKNSKQTSKSPFAEITEDDIEKLFG
ncbi:MAG: roadblock/LC7 domain-containing protein [Nitrospirae bacterium]|nr:roadblock/LC7 domain-containing protein [Nitrospirota bacterium]MBI3593904.1 roadblock/LC7 domain-containing protein [Nitrospirota bacterium]